QGVAGVELHAVAELEGPGRSVVGDRVVGGEARDELVDGGAVVDEERLVDVLDDPARTGVVSPGRVHRYRLAARHVDVRIRRRLRRGEAEPRTSDDRKAAALHSVLPWSETRDVTGSAWRRVLEESIFPAPFVRGATPLFTTPARRQTLLLRSRL